MQRGREGKKKGRTFSLISWKEGKKGGKADKFIRILPLLSKKREGGGREKGDSYQSSIRRGEGGGKLPYVVHQNIPDEASGHEFGKGGKGGRTLPSSRRGGGKKKKKKKLLVLMRKGDERAVMVFFPRIPGKKKKGKKGEGGELLGECIEDKRKEKKKGKKPGGGQPRRKGKKRGSRP